MNAKEYINDMKKGGHNLLYPEGSDSEPFAVRVGEGNGIWRAIVAATDCLFHRSLCCAL